MSNSDLEAFGEPYAPESLRRAARNRELGASWSHADGPCGLCLRGEGETSTPSWRICVATARAPKADAHRCCARNRAADSCSRLPRLPPAASPAAPGPPDAAAVAAARGGQSPSGGRRRRTPRRQARQAAAADRAENAKTKERGARKTHAGHERQSMARLLAAATLAATAGAFLAPAPVSTPVVVRAENSEAFPFLKRPEKLDGSMVGDVGFDPLRLAEVQVDLTYARGAEVKHGRIAMLACVGFIIQEYWHLPGADYQNFKPLTAPWTVPWAANLQILALAGAIEPATADKTYGETPWDLGFDPLCFQEGKSKAEMDRLMLGELTNGRLAMMAFVGMVIQTLFDKPLMDMHMGFLRRKEKRFIRHIPARVDGVAWRLTDVDQAARRVEQNGRPRRRRRRRESHRAPGARPRSPRRAAPRFST